MEFSISPQPSPTAPLTFPNHIQDAIDQLRRRRLGNAFEALMDLGDEMHDAVDEIAVVGDLRQVNCLFSSIIRYSAYGVYQPVDRVIHKLLLLAVQRCENLREARAEPNRGRLGWQSPAQCDADEHLELCRNILSYIMSHPTHLGSQDETLVSAQRSLQRLCPRINGLSKWTWAEEPLVEGHGRSRRKATRPSALQLQPAAKKRPPPRPACRPRAPMPTPPTQSGDIGFAETVPTLPLMQPNRWGVAPQTPDLQSLSHTLGRSLLETAVPDGHGAETTQHFHTGSAVSARQMGSRVLARHTTHSHSDFKLRPEHIVSSRCCAASGMCMGSAG